MTHTKLSYLNSRFSIRSGFTLIELSVVVTCFGLLIGLAQPSLLTARNKSKLSVCLDRLRAIGVASALYSNEDPSSMAIPVHPLQYAQDPANPTYIGAYEWGGKSGIGRPGFADRGGSGVLSSKYGTAAGFGPASRPLNNYMYPHGFLDSSDPYDRNGAERDTLLTLDAYRCPADDGPPGGAHCPDWINNPHRTSYDHFGNSYAANLFMISSAGGGYLSSNSPYLRPVTRVPNPSRVIHYEENIGRWAWAAKRENDACQWIGQGVDPGPTKGIRGWHGKDWIFNRSFVDTHAERQQVYLEGTQDADGYALHYFNELVYPGNEGQQEQFKCIIIRGHGWQKDTLPNDPILTGLVSSGVGRGSNEDCVQSD